MSTSTLYVLFAASVLAPAAKQLPAEPPDVLVAVFRHHPGMIHDRGQRQAADADAEALQEVALKACGLFKYCGEPGSGYYLIVPSSKLGAWNGAVEKLLKAGTLRYYDQWELDAKGFGLFPVAGR